jgi:hypothetical protein
MPILRYAPHWRHQTEESRRPSAITGSHIMAAWLGVLLINAAVMVAIFFPMSASPLGNRDLENRDRPSLASSTD